MVAIPLLASAVVSVLPSARIAWGVAFVTTLCCLYMAFELTEIVSASLTLSYAFGGWEPPWGIAFVVDGANVHLVLLVAFISVIATVYALTTLKHEIAVEDLPKAYAVWLLTIASLFGLSMTGDAFNLFVFLEISALSSITLIALGAGQDRRALLAAYNYLIIGAIGATFYVIGVGYLYAATGTLNLLDIIERLNEIGTNQAAVTGLSFMLAGIMVKAGVFPVHIWLPAAYSFAPSAVSSLLSAIATKVAIYYLARLLFGIFILVTPFGKPIFSWFDKLIKKLLSFSNDGSEFLFSSFIDGKMHPAVINFAFSVLPTVIFFSALFAVLYHIGLMQKVIQIMAVVMQ